MMLQSHILTLCTGECMQVANCGQCCGMDVHKPKGREVIPVKVDGAKPNTIRKLRKVLPNSTLTLRLLSLDKCE